MKKLYGDENGQVKIGELDIGDIKKLKRFFPKLRMGKIFLKPQKNIQRMFRQAPVEMWVSLRKVKWFPNSRMLFID